MDKHGRHGLFIAVSEPLNALRLNAVLYRTSYRPVPLQEYILCGRELLNPDGSQAGYFQANISRMPLRSVKSLVGLLQWAVVCRDLS